MFITKFVLKKNTEDTQLYHIYMFFCFLGGFLALELAPVTVTSPVNQAK